MGKDKKGLRQRKSGAPEAEEKEALVADVAGSSVASPSPPVSSASAKKAAAVPASSGVESDYDSEADRIRSVRLRTRAADARRAARSAEARDSDDDDDADDDEDDGADDPHRQPFTAPDFGPQSDQDDSLLFAAAAIGFFLCMACAAALPRFGVPQEFVMAGGMAALILYIVAINFCTCGRKPGPVLSPIEQVTPQMVFIVAGCIGSMLGGMFGGVLKHAKWT